MAHEHVPDERIISSQFPGTCTDCKQRFPKDTLIKHNRYKKTARHVQCPDPYDGREHENLFNTNLPPVI
jgi:hypothetical protein